MIESMDRRIAGDDEYKKEVSERIRRLKKEKNAVILAHNYQRDEIQEIADICGDSLALAKAARDVEADMIVFCGVLFMAESAVILNPEKKVVLPVMEAGCPLAQMASVEQVREYREQYPDAAVVCYVNTLAEIKAESDICCTSSNAVDIVKSLPHKQVIFLPDRNLGKHVARNVPEKEIILWPGFCQIHMKLREKEVVKAKEANPNAFVLAHPECEPEVLKHADHITSTGGMISYVKESDKTEFIIATEKGINYALNQAAPEKKFIFPSDNLICASMKLTTLGWLAHALEHEVYEVKVEEEIRQKAFNALDRMMKVK